jgi:hypothetical protein
MEVDSVDDNEWRDEFLNEQQDECATEESYSDIFEEVFIETFWDSHYPRGKTNCNTHDKTFLSGTTMFGSEITSDFPLQQENHVD